MCSTTRDPDRKVVLAAMEQRADALQYASAELKADREVVLAGVQREGRQVRSSTPLPSCGRTARWCWLRCNGREDLHFSTPPQS